MLKSCRVRWYCLSKFWPHCDYQTECRAIFPILREQLNRFFPRLHIIPDCFILVMVSIPVTVASIAIKWIFFGSTNIFTCHVMRRCEIFSRLMTRRKLKCRGICFCEAGIVIIILHMIRLLKNVSYLFRSKWPNQIVCCILRTHWNISWYSRIQDRDMITSHATWTRKLTR